MRLQMRFNCGVAKTQAALELGLTCIPCRRDIMRAVYLPFNRSFSHGR
jgi:hypothetical protein